MSGSKAFREPSVRQILDHFKINKWESWRKMISFSPFCFGRKLLFPRGFLLGSQAAVVKFPGEFNPSELPSVSSLLNIIQIIYLCVHLAYFSAQRLGCVILKFLDNETGKKM